MMDPVSIYCPYCHKHTALSHANMEFGTLAGQHLTGWGTWSDAHAFTWWVGICNSCQRPVLVCGHGDVIYPVPLPSPTDERLPPHIMADVVEAKMCFSVSAFRACAVMARRAMQSTCKDKGAKKEKLRDQLGELAANVTITKDLLEWATLVRWVGNDAAHPDKEEVTEEDAVDILSLTEQFLNVIYVAPAIASERREKRGK